MKWLSMMKYHPSVLWARFRGLVRRLWYRWHRLRPASGPFVSGDSFRALAHHVWDEKDEPSFNLDQIRPYDILFVSWHIWKFLTEVAPRIQVPFFLISSNSDQPISRMEVDAFERTKGLRWWAANLIVEASRVTAIPLGLQNHSYVWYGDTQDLIRVAKSSRGIEKLDRLCWGFAVQNNPEVRGPIRDALRRNPKAVELPNLDPYSYRRVLVKYRFVASPPGNAPDAHRTWEALALGVTPVLLESGLTRNFEALGLTSGMVILKTVAEFESFLCEAKQGD